MRRFWSSRRRGSGTTTKQITNAPIGATYVWVNADVIYPQQQARKLGRTDLTFVGPDFINNQHRRGNNRPIVFDHAYGKQ